MEDTFFGAMIYDNVPGVQQRNVVYFVNIYRLNGTMAPNVSLLCLPRKEPHYMTAMYRIAAHRGLCSSHADHSSTEVAARAAAGNYVISLQNRFFQVVPEPLITTNSTQKLHKKMVLKKRKRSSLTAAQERSRSSKKKQKKASIIPPALSKQASKAVPVPAKHIPASAIVMPAKTSAVTVAAPPDPEVRKILTTVLGRLDSLQDERDIERDLRAHEYALLRDIQEGYAASMQTLSNVTKEVKSVVRTVTDVTSTLSLASRNLFENNAMAAEDREANLRRMDVLLRQKDGQLMTALAELAVLRARHTLMPMTDGTRFLRGGFDNKYRSVYTFEKPVAPRPEDEGVLACGGQPAPVAQ